jgi:hypothetical protein
MAFFDLKSFLNSGQTFKCSLKGPANIYRLCSGIYQKSKAALRRRNFRSRTEANSICSGFHHYRPTLTGTDVWIWRT